TCRVASPSTSASAQPCAQQIPPTAPPSAPRDPPGLLQFASRASPTSTDQKCNLNWFLPPYFMRLKLGAWSTCPLPVSSISLRYSETTQPRSGSITYQLIGKGCMCRF